MRDRWPGWWLAGLLVVAVLVPTNLSVPTAALVLLLVGGSRWSVRRTARRLAGRCTLPGWADHGQDVEAVLDLRNGSRLPAPWMELDLPAALGLGRRDPYREAVALAPLDEVTRTVPLRCSRRGRHQVGPLRVRIGDVFGMTDARVTLGETATITVFPRIVPLERLGLPALSPFVTVPSQRSLLVDPTAVVGVRDYRAGDPLSAVHWTATARTEKLMVKQYERAEARETLVCLDLSARGYARDSLQSAVELAITVAASVLHHSVAVQRLAAGLVAASWAHDPPEPVLRLPPRTDQAHLRQMLEVLALAQPTARTPLAEVLAGLRRVAPGTTVLVVTGTLDPEIAAHLVRLAREGAPVAAALTGPTAEEDSLTVEDLWLPVYRITETPAVARLAG